ncbi:RNA polymerase sigma factor SigJ [Cellvibrio zantedeschiae]|uniref:RNA polymerase sigma factor SigJ n=1 Tax=Cellvibrio zantedeschiae TaxID=1237077 RepID=A0ABQ3B8J9_9GAMM|nr:RNA polymerase sigma factor SigJ [Cellvibrio zantedeschiae]GGY79060.1 RNA polymerase sigma factor SigJ [Cellvibrio zantedeschiae]
MLTLPERALRYDREHSRNLRALAYRMLGSRSEAEDIVQEAWLRWAEVDETLIQHAGAYLSRLVTNLCLDKLKSASARREQYVGVWLPEPLLDQELGWSLGPEERAEFAHDVSVAFMLALERLSPLERAAFLLHDVFDLDFEEIGKRLERSPSACRQLSSRARNHVKADYARREVKAEESERLFAAFNDAVRNLDLDAFANILSEDAIMLSDGGGKVNAVPYPLKGRELVAKTFIGFAKLPTSRTWHIEPARINGLPGCLILDSATGHLVQTVTLSLSANEPGRIDAIYIQRNPDKLQSVLAALRPT